MTLRDTSRHLAPSQLECDNFMVMGRSWGRVTRGLRRISGVDIISAACVSCVYEVINAGKQRGWLVDGMGSVVESVKCRNDLKRVTKLAEKLR